MATVETPTIPAEVVPAKVTKPRVRKAPAEGTQPKPKKEPKAKVVKEKVVKEKVEKPAKEPKAPRVRKQKPVKEGEEPVPVDTTPLGSVKSSVRRLFRLAKLDARVGDDKLRLIPDRLDAEFRTTLAEIVAVSETNPKKNKITVENVKAVIGDVTIVTDKNGEVIKDPHPEEGKEPEALVTILARAPFERYCKDIISQMGKAAKLQADALVLLQQYYERLIDNILEASIVYMSSQDMKTINETTIDTVLAITKLMNRK
jgi:histone H3/H4